MNSSRNLIVALLALWCYAHNSNINLANNTTMLLILYVLLSRNNVSGNQNILTPTRPPMPFPNSNNGNGPTMQPPFGAPFNNNSFAQPAFAMPFNNSFTTPLF